MGHAAPPSQMPRRSQTVDVVGSVAQLVGYVVLVSLFISLFVPVVRRALFAFGFIAGCLLMLAIAGVTGLGLYRRVTQGGRMKTMADNPFASPSAAANEASDLPDETGNDVLETTLDEPVPALRRRYPWRH